MLNIFSSLVQDQDIKFNIRKSSNMRRDLYHCELLFSVSELSEKKLVDGPLWFVREQMFLYPCFGTLLEFYEGRDRKESKEARSFLRTYL